MLIDYHSFLCYNYQGFSETLRKNVRKKHTLRHKTVYIAPPEGGFYESGILYSRLQGQPI